MCLIPCAAEVLQQETMLGPDKAGQGTMHELDHGGHVGKLGRRRNRETSAKNVWGPRGDLSALTS